MQGIAPPAAAAKPLPQVSPQLIAACKAHRPDFGQGKAPSSAAVIQPLPASAALPLAAQTPTTAQAPSGVSTETHLPMTSLPALTAQAAGTGSIAVEMETTSGGKTALGNATRITPATGKPVVEIQFGQGNQQANALQSCLAGKCTLARVTITQTVHSSGGERTPTTVYTLTGATVSQLARTPCAAPSTEHSCVGPLLATFTYEQFNVTYPAPPAH